MEGKLREGSTPPLPRSPDFSRLPEELVRKMYGPKGPLARTRRRLVGKMVCTAWRRALLHEPFPRLSLADSEGLFEWVEARRPTVLWLDFDSWDVPSFEELQNTINSQAEPSGEAAAWKARISQALTTLGQGLRRLRLSCAGGEDELSPIPLDRLISQPLGLLFPSLDTLKTDWHDSDLDSIALSSPNSWVVALLRLQRLEIHLSTAPEEEALPLPPALTSLYVHSNLGPNLKLNLDYTPRLQRINVVGDAYGVELLCTAPAGHLTQVHSSLPQIVLDLRRLPALKTLSLAGLWELDEAGSAASAPLEAPTQLQLGCKGEAAAEQAEQLLRCAPLPDICLESCMHAGWTPALAEAVGSLAGLHTLYGHLDPPPGLPCWRALRVRKTLGLGERMRTNRRPIALPTEATALHELELDRVEEELSADNIATLCALRSLKRIRLVCSNADQVAAALRKANPGIEFLPPHRSRFETMELSKSDCWFGGIDGDEDTLDEEGSEDGEESSEAEESSESAAGAEAPGDV